jgi:hypothetical protein
VILPCGGHGAGTCLGGFWQAQRVIEKPRREVVLSRLRVEEPIELAHLSPAVIERIKLYQSDPDKLLFAGRAAACDKFAGEEFFWPFCIMHSSLSTTHSGDAYSCQNPYTEAQLHAQPPAHLDTIHSWRDLLSRLRCLGMRQDRGIGIDALPGT